MTPFDFIDRPLDALNQSDLMLIFDVAELSAPPMRKRLLKTLLRRLNRQPQRDDELLGHTAYALAALSGNKRRKRLKIALRCFARMAHRQPENGFAQIYLAYTLYDLGKFKGSLKVLRRISKNYFAKRRQRWRDLERQQLAICCLLRLGKTRHLPAQLADLFARTARAKPVDCPQPEALAATLQWLVHRGEPSRKQNTNTAA